MCTSDSIADEYHYLFICNNTKVIYLRNQSIPNFFITNRTMSKFSELLSSVSSNMAQAKKLNSYFRDLFKLLSEYSHSSQF